MDILSRLEMMVLMGMELPLSAIRQQIASGIDIIVHLARLSDKSRRVVEISEVDGIMENQIVLRPLYRLEQEGDGYELKEQAKLKHTQKLMRFNG